MERGVKEKKKDLGIGSYMTIHSPSVDFRMVDRDTRDFCILGPPLRSSSRRSRAFGKFCAGVSPLVHLYANTDKTEKAREGRTEERVAV